MRRHLLYVLVFAVGAVACIDFGAFTCEQDSDCTLDGIDGRCHDGGCSYPDDSCDSGFRVETNASGELAGECVPVELTCDSYCERFPAVCSVDFNPYPNPDACKAQCRQWPVGTVDDRTTDSLGCRLHHLSLRADNWNEAVNCITAGPSGGADCRTEDAPTCQQYCQVFMTFCEANFGPVYGSLDDCANSCSGWYPGVLDEMPQDSVGCRLVHATVAATSEDPALTPQHRMALCHVAGPSGGDICVPPSE